MSTGVWAIVATIAGVVLTFLFGSRFGKLKTAEKRNDELEKAIEQVKAEERNAEAKAVSEERKADLAVTIMGVISEKVPGLGPSQAVREMEQAVNAATPDQDTDLLALEIARRQAAQAASFIEEHK